MAVSELADEEGNGWYFGKYVDKVIGAPEKVAGGVKDLITEEREREAKTMRMIIIGIIIMVVIAVIVFAFYKYKPLEGIKLAPETVKVSALGMG